MSEDLAEIERVAGALLRSLSSSQRRAVMRRMARDLATSQRTRIVAQRQPDGSAFAPRAKKTPPISGRGPACFLYPAGGGEPRRVVMPSFTWGANGQMTGYDVEARGVRTFDRAKVVKWLPIPPEHRNAAGKAPRRRGGLKRQAMFRRLAASRWLRTGVDDFGLWVGWNGRAAQIANVHQHGLRDRPSLRAKAMSYPQRELLGATADDRERMLDALYAHLAGSG